MRAIIPNVLYIDSNINISSTGSYSSQSENVISKSLLQKLCKRRTCANRTARKRVSDHKESSERKMFEPSEEMDYQLNSSNMDHLRYILESFLSSTRPDGCQLGRNHPRSVPERFEINKYNEFSSNTCNGIDEVNARPYYLRSTSASSVHDDRNEYLNYETLFSNEDVELSNGSSDTFEEQNLCEIDMSVLLEISDIQPFSDFLIKEPKPHYPVGEWNSKECGICLETKWMHIRYCCQFPACDSCLEQYYTSKVKQGIIQIECCNFTCHSYVHRDEISVKLHSDTKENFRKLLVSAQTDKFTKPCPQCNHVIRMNPHNTKNKNQISATKIQCPDCQLEWCFQCHAPWHAKLSCKKFQKGDRLIKYWARKTNMGERNAQRCPKCKIYIQKIEGCNHIHCTRCLTNFCYRCGDKYRKLKFFGDHDSRFSVFGCKYIYKSKKPIQRKLIRGAIFGSKIVVAPVLGALALCATGFGIILFPVYGGILYYRYRKNK